MNILNNAEQVAKKVGLTKQSEDYDFQYQNEFSNDYLIDLIQDEANGCYNDELWVFSECSCINRQVDEYFLNDDVAMLDVEFSTRVNYLQLIKNANYFKK